MIEVKYCMDIVLMFVRVSCMLDPLSWNVFLMISNDGMWVEPLTPDVMIIRGETFHLLILISSRSGVYLFILCCMSASKNLSFVYVNLINYIVYLGSGSGGGGVWYGNEVGLIYKFAISKLNDPLSAYFVGRQNNTTS